MKMTVKQPGARMRAGLRTRAEAWLTKRPAKTALRCLGTFAAALVLSAAPLGKRPLPLAASLVLALDFFPYSLLAALGSVAGAALFWPWTQALEPVAVTVLCYAAAGLFHDAGLPESERFAGILGLCLSAAVGFVFLLDGGFSAEGLAFFAARLLLALTGPILWRRAVKRRSPMALWGAGLCLFVGCASLFPPYSAYAAAGLGYAVCLTTSGKDMLPTLLCGLGLDLTGMLPCSLTAPLAGAALCCRTLPKKQPPWRALCFVLVGLGWQLLRGVFSLPLLSVMLLGSGLGLLLPEIRQGEPALSSEPKEEADPALSKAARAFAQLHRSLTGPTPKAEGIASVYDEAADTVCTHCVRSKLCWQTHAAETYEDLCAAAGPILERGCALREDFPEGFLRDCCHTEGLLTAINQAMDHRRARRQLQNRLGESRRVLASQYLFLSRYLGKLAEGEAASAEAQARYAPEFAVSGTARAGESVSGDRGASFRDRWDHFYVLLLDGMGSGSGAARQSSQDLHALTGLLEAGVAPDAALEILNGVCVLREDSGFSTVDLLQLDLRSGEGVLYKWGAAPSYLKTGKRLQTLGSPLPPPGWDLGCRPQQLRLSLGEGEILLLLSDGADSPETRERAAGFGGESLQALSSTLVASLGQTREDDATVAAVRLKKTG